MFFSISPKPVGVFANSVTGKCKLLVNNQWVYVVDLIFCSPNCAGHIDPLMLGESLEKIEAEVEGVKEWFNWGPRLN